MDAKEFFQLAKIGDNQELSKLLDDDPTHLYRVDRNGWSLLHWVCSGDAGMDTFDLLLDSGIDYRIVDKGGNTALHIACWVGRQDFAGRLAEMGLELTKKYSKGLTPIDLTNSTSNGHGIFLMARSGDISSLKKLIHHNPKAIHSKDEDGWTPLHWATSQGHSKIVAMLLQVGASSLRRSSDGQIPLHLAARYGFLEILKLLLADDSSGMNIQTKKKLWTPLHFACYHQHFSVAAVLIDQGANTHVENHDHRYPLHYITDADQKRCLVEFSHEKSDTKGSHNRDDDFRISTIEINSDLKSSESQQDMPIASMLRPNVPAVEHSSKESSPRRKYATASSFESPRRGPLVNTVDDTAGLVDSARIDAPSEHPSLAGLNQSAPSSISHTSQKVCSSGETSHRVAAIAPPMDWALQRERGEIADLRGVPNPLDDSKRIAVLHNLTEHGDGMRTNQSIDSGSNRRRQPQVTQSRPMSAENIAAMKKAAMRVRAHRRLKTEEEQHPRGLPGYADEQQRSPINHQQRMSMVQRDREMLQEQRVQHLQPRLSPQSHTQLKPHKPHEHQLGQEQEQQPSLQSRHAMTYSYGSFHQPMMLQRTDIFNETDGHDLRISGDVTDMFMTSCTGADYRLSQQRQASNIAALASQADMQQRGYGNDRYNTCNTSVSNQMQDDDDYHRFDNESRLHPVATSSSPVIGRVVSRSPSLSLSPSPSHGEPSGSQSSVGQGSGSQSSGGQGSRDQSSGSQSSRGHSSGGQGSRDQRSGGQSSRGQSSRGQSSRGQESRDQRSGGRDQRSGGQSSGGQGSGGQSSRDQRSGGQSSRDQRSGGQSSWGPSSGGQGRSRNQCRLDAATVHGPAFVLDGDCSTSYGWQGACSGTDRTLIIDCSFEMWLADLRLLDYVDFFRCLGFCMIEDFQEMSSEECDHFFFQAPNGCNAEPRMRVGDARRLLRHIPLVNSDFIAGYEHMAGEKLRNAEAKVCEVCVGDAQESSDDVAYAKGNTAPHFTLDRPATMGDEKGLQSSDKPNQYESDTSQATSHMAGNELEVNAPEEFIPVPLLLPLETAHLQPAPPMFEQRNQCGETISLDFCDTAM